MNGVAGSPVLIAGLKSCAIVFSLDRCLQQLPTVDPPCLYLAASCAALRRQPKLRAKSSRFFPDSSRTVLVGFFSALAEAPTVKWLQVQKTLGTPLAMLFDVGFHLRRPSTQRFLRHMARTPQSVDRSTFGLPEAGRNFLDLVSANFFISGMNLNGWRTSFRKQNFLSCRMVDPYVAHRPCTILQYCACLGVGGWGQSSIGPKKMSYYGVHPGVETGTDVILSPFTWIGPAL